MSNLSIGFTASGGSSAIHGPNPSLFAGALAPTDNHQCELAAPGSLYIQTAPGSISLYQKIDDSKWISLTPASAKVTTRGSKRSK